MADPAFQYESSNSVIDVGVYRVRMSDGTIRFQPYITFSSEEGEIEFHGQTTFAREEELTGLIATLEEAFSGLPSSEFNGDDDYDA